MNGTVLDEETSVVDLTHLEFQVPCADPPDAAPHAAEVFVVCRLCNRHVPQCRAHFERMRAWFIMQESAARLMGGHPTATCRACLGEAPTFDELVTTVPVKP